MCFGGKKKKRKRRRGLSLCFYSEIIPRSPLTSFVFSCLLKHHSSFCSLILDPLLHTSRLLHSLKHFYLVAPTLICLMPAQEYPLAPHLCHLTQICSSFEQSQIILVQSEFYFSKFLYYISVPCIWHINCSLVYLIISHVCIKRSLEIVTIVLSRYFNNNQQF